MKKHNVSAGPEALNLNHFAGINLKDLDIPLAN